MTSTQNATCVLHHYCRREVNSEVLHYTLTLVFNSRYTMIDIRICDEQEHKLSFDAHSHEIPDMHALL